MKVSVIIPIYQVEDTLDECLRSCFNQKYKNIEFLMINDGSFDNSESICREWESKDKRFILYNKKNGGLSDARNFGLKKATGDYVLFLDSDDKLGDNLFDKLSPLLLENEYDVISFMITRDKFKLDVDMNKTIVTDRNEGMKIILSDNSWGTSACNKFFNKSLFHNIDFPKGKLYEDLGTVYKIIDQTKKNIFISYYGYYYRISENSITTQKFTPNQFDMLEYSDEIIKFLSYDYPNIEYVAINRKIRCILKIFVSISINNYEMKKETYLTYQTFVKSNLLGFLKSEYSHKHKVSAIFFSISPRLFYKIVSKTYG